uniref:Uncharacterized protein n=1 Tax=Nelumbo nucifera TaxID=4432 RepID=A0A822Z4L9_NELNU|nr:TPA_asm: hypothetical protein HUJ06_009000 [Nelumbo nucifera]
MASISSILLQVLVIQFLVALGVSQCPSFYYFGQEVRSALCASTEGCCFPTLRGLIRRMQRNWSSFSCPSSNSESFWAYQWKKYGTCSLPTFGTQHAYFKAALDLKDRVDLLQILEDEGIKPTGQYYSREKIIQAVRTATGYTPSVVCSDDKFGRNQLYEIHLCVDKSGSHFIECPVYFTPTCNSIVRFAPFDDDAAVGGIYLPS